MYIYIYIDFSPKKLEVILNQLFYLRNEKNYRVNDFYSFMKVYSWQYINIIKEHNPLFAQFHPF